MNAFTMKILSCCILFMLSFALLANHHQAPYDSLVEKYYTSAKTYMNTKKYDSAHAQFKAMFKLQSTIPDDAAYYYGLNQLYRKNYKQASNGFDKYLRLRGDKGVYSDSSLYYISKIQCLEKGFIEERETCTLCKGEGHTKVKCHKCKGVGKEYCSICSGSGVLISKSSMGDNYQKCYKCEGTGITLCSVCKGTTFEEGECPQCKGNGFVLVRKECK